LRDTYIRYRDAQIAKYGNQTNSIWEAIPEMSRVSGYNFYDLSRVLAKISFQLILKHPWLFINSAIQGWWMFWRISVYWSAELVRFPQLVNALKVAVQIERMGLFLVNLGFIFSSLYFTISEFLSILRKRHTRTTVRFDHPAQRMVYWLLLGTIWITSILQTLLDHGDNPRFLVPLQSLVVLWVAAFTLQLLQNNRVANKTINQAG
jgi:hypothetical protein